MWLEVTGSDIKADPLWGDRVAGTARTAYLCLSVGAGGRLRLSAGASKDLRWDFWIKQMQGIATETLQLGLCGEYAEASTVTLGEPTAVSTADQCLHVVTIYFCMSMLGNDGRMVRDSKIIQRLLQSLSCCAVVIRKLLALPP